MKNCLILGCGRSGTSMVAGSLAKAGYFMGNHLIQAREGNPKGFFQDIEIISINEALLSPVIPENSLLIGELLFQDRPLQHPTWLARVPLTTKIPISLEIEKQIQEFTTKEPFCFKDPRFCYTLPNWRPYLINTVFICIFRDPISTAKSILKEIEYASNVHKYNFNINFNQALDVWILMYKHILDIHRFEGQWLFLHYNQVLYGEGLKELATFTDASIDYSFPDISLHRSQRDQPIPKRTEAIYQQLCELAKYTGSIPILQK